MTIILFIRHGENDYVKKARLAGRLPGVHLNEKGITQAQKVAEALKDVPLTAVYSSPLERTVETAAPIAEAHGKKVIVRSGLLELDMGDWQDRTLKSLSKLKVWRTVQNRPSLHRFPNGESFQEAQQRMVNEVEALLKLHKPKDVIACVGHSDLIKLAVSYYMGMSLDSFQRLMISPASISTVLVGEGHATVFNVNVSATGFSFPQPPPKSKKKKKTDSK